MYMTDLTLGTLELTVLLTVSRLATDAYGFAIRRDIAERTGREHSVGALYTTLQRLQDKGLVTSHATAPLPVRGGRSRRQYKLTATGARSLLDAQRHAESMWAGMGKRVRPRLG
ncbi:MAG: putative PadR family transcriptional regulator [Gemmatimonadetes bacterium]|nr:putative PadR family transcriptional regulator [Gemmatimonadota bacterium]